MVCLVDKESLDTFRAYDLSFDMLFSLRAQPLPKALPVFANAPSLDITVAVVDDVAGLPGLALRARRWLLQQARPRLVLGCQQSEGRAGKGLPGL